MRAAAATTPASSDRPDRSPLDSNLAVVSEGRGAMGSEVGGAQQVCRTGGGGPSGPDAGKCMCRLGSQRSNDGTRCSAVEAEGTLLEADGEAAVNLEHVGGGGVGRRGGGGGHGDGGRDGSEPDTAERTRHQVMKAEKDQVGRESSLPNVTMRTSSL